MTLKILAIESGDTEKRRINSIRRFMFSGEVMKLFILSGNFIF